MAITRAKKVELLEELKGMVTGAVSIVFLHFKGMTTKETNEIRLALKKDGMRYSVVKKTLLSRTLTEAGIKGDAPELTGEVAIAYLPKESGDDASAPARGLNEFVKKFKTKLVFLGGVVDGTFVSKSDTEVYASIPSVQVLRGMFANIINSPIQRFAIALGEVAKKK
ncbi:MAG: 50S ribosomal protein L10 [Patescibacteria group bacterium]